jgi:hypothetical protein
LIEVEHNIFFSSGIMTSAGYIENIEVNAWLDVILSQPTLYRREKGFKIHRVGDVWVTACHSVPFTLFNRPLNLGVQKPTNEEQIDTIIAWFGSEGISQFMMHATPATRPSETAGMLLRRNFKQTGCWHRVVRKAGALREEIKVKGLTVEEVNRNNGAAWADFIEGVYHMPTTDWLLNLIGKAGWHHVVCKENGKIIAARSMHINPDHSCYMMLDAPAPGLMTDRCEPDLLLAQQLIRIALNNHANLIASDIEKASETMDTPVYDYWKKLDFEFAYAKLNFVH